MRERRGTIRGLLPRFHAIRERLRRGIPPEEAGAFRVAVRETLAQVEAICASAGIRPDDLPPATQNAYRSLAAMDLKHLPPPNPAVASTPPVSLRGAASLTQLRERHLWNRREAFAATASTRDSFRNTLLGDVEAIEQVVASARSTPAGLVGSGRALYAWLRFLLEDEHLERHVEALNLASRALATVVPDATCEVLMGPRQSLWRARRRPGEVSLAVSEGFVAAAQDEWQALVRVASSRAQAAHVETLRRFAESARLRDVMTALESYVRNADHAKGRVHDLAASFDRVNRAVFGGAMTRPTLAWSRIPSRRLQAQYRPGSDAIVFSVALDDERVPESVVDFLMAHELLHRKHGARFQGARRASHTPEFREEERRLPWFEEARRFLDRFAAARRP